MTMAKGMRTWVLVLLVALLSISIRVCDSSILGGEEEGKVKLEEARDKAAEASDSWAEWAKEKLTEGLRFNKANDETPTGEAKETAWHTAEEAKKKAEEAKEKASEKVGETAEEAKEKLREARESVSEEEQLSWAKEKAKEGFEVAKAKAGETIESAKEAIEAAKQKSKEIKDNLAGRPKDEEL